MASASVSSEGKQSAQRRKSCDTICSSNSSCFLHKRKPVHPLASSIRTYVPRSSGNTVKQRVLSARLLKLRSLQNQLNDANFHLAELQQENRALKNLQTRQDKALSKYEGTHADLPKLLRSHEEEIRVLLTKNKILRKNLKDVSDQLKVKEEELANVREQFKNLMVLSKNKNLGERQTLSDQVEEFKQKLKSSEDQINLLNRKLLLESKNYKYKLNAEISKNKQSQKDLNHALAEIDRLVSLLEAKGNVVSKNQKRFVNVNQSRQSISLINLLGNKETNRSAEKKAESRVSFASDAEENISDRSDVRLEPLTGEKELKSIDFSTDNIMSSPSENVKARLSCKNDEKEHISKNLNQFKLSTDKEEVKSSLQRSRPSSSQKLEKLLGNNAGLHQNFENSVSVLNRNESKTEIAQSAADISINELQQHKPEEDFTEAGQTENSLGQILNSYSKEVFSISNTYSATVNKHKQDFETAKSETQKLLENLRETDAINSKLRHANFLIKEPLEIPSNDLSLVDKILKDEYVFSTSAGHRETTNNTVEKNESKDLKIKNSVVPENDSFSLYENAAKGDVKEFERVLLRSDKNGNVVKKTDVMINDKTKLLAALRAIDNGEVEDVSSFELNMLTKKKSNLIDEF